MANLYYVRRAVAGVSWLSHMYRSDLELVRGDGAITQTALRVRYTLFHFLYWPYGGADVFPAPGLLP